MRLTKKQKELFNRRFPSLVESGCPVCRKGNFVVNDTIFELREFQGGGLYIGDQYSILPVISVVCNHCGHTLFFNAVLLGLVKPEPTSRDGKD